MWETVSGRRSSVLLELILGDEEELLKGNKERNLGERGVFGSVYERLEAAWGDGQFSLAVHVAELEEKATLGDELLDDDTSLQTS
ncbi:hypothetical protein LTR95_018842, partial [Oleoguttula sp. CCFEE 5521]